MYFLQHCNDLTSPVRRISSLTCDFINVSYLCLYCISSTEVHSELRRCFGINLSRCGSVILILHHEPCRKCILILERHGDGQISKVLIPPEYLYVDLPDLQRIIQVGKLGNRNSQIVWLYADCIAMHEYIHENKKICYLQTCLVFKLICLSQE